MLVPLPCPCILAAVTGRLAALPSAATPPNILFIWELVRKLRAQLFQIKAEIGDTDDNYPELQKLAGS